MTVTWDEGAVAALEARVRAGVTRAVVAASEAVLAEGTSLIAMPPKTGRIYRRTLPRREHQASAPGEAPAADLGGLIASGQAGAPVQLADRVVCTVSWSTSYALALELGTARMAARPFARPALDHVAPTLLEGVTAELQRAGLRVR